MYDIVLMIVKNTGCKFEIRDILIGGSLDSDHQSEQHLLQTQS